MILLLFGLMSMSDVGDWVKTALVLLLLLWSLRWAYRDAEARGKSGCLISGVVFFFGWPISLIVWLIFRPDEYTEEHRFEQKIEADTDRIECAQCGIKIRRGRSKCICGAERVPGPAEVRDNESV